MANKSDDRDARKYVTATLYLGDAAIVLAVAAGPVQSWINKARKGSAHAGLTNLRDAYTAYYSTKSAYPGPDLKELKLENGGTIQECPWSPIAEARRSALLWTAPAVGITTWPSTT